jgi:anti-anti-sigma regulatory factor
MNADAPAPEAPFRLDEMPDRGIAVLRVRGELTVENRRAFVALAEKLLACEQPKLVIDLSRLQRVFSMFIGTFIDLDQQARAQGQSLSFMMTQTVADMVRMVRDDDEMAIVVIDQPA